MQWRSWRLSHGEDEGVPGQRGAQLHCTNPTLNSIISADGPLHPALLSTPQSCTWCSFVHEQSRNVVKYTLKRCTEIWNCCPQTIIVAAFAQVQKLEHVLQQRLIFIFQIEMTKLPFNVFEECRWKLFQVGGWIRFFPDVCVKNYSRITVYSRSIKSALLQIFKEPKKKGRREDSECVCSDPK